MQLTIFLSDHNALDQSQHGFISGRSTVTNMLHFDTAIAAILSKNHAYDVISVDFKKAFDKAPHHHVLEALAIDWALATVLCNGLEDFLPGEPSRRASAIVYLLPVT